MYSLLVRIPSTMSLILMLISTLVIPSRQLFVPDECLRDLFRPQGLRNSICDAHKRSDLNRSIIDLLASTLKADDQRGIMGDRISAKNIDVGMADSRKYI